MYSRFFSRSWIISIHVPREGDDLDDVDVVPALVISIHVPREGDDKRRGREEQLGVISIHVPREGDDDPCQRAGDYVHHFNPRPP